MSFQAMARVSPFKARSGTEKLMLFLLANYADEQGVTWPSQKKLACDGSVDLSTVARALAGLEKAGAICRQTRFRKNGSRSSDIIAIMCGRPAGTTVRWIETELGIEAVFIEATRQIAGGEGSPHDAGGEGSPHDAGGTPAQSGGPPCTKQGPEPIIETVIEESPLTPQGGGGDGLKASRKQPSAKARAMAAEIWDSTPKGPGRERSGQTDLARALDGALERGHDPGAVKVALGVYYSDPRTMREEGRWAKGLHRMVEQDRWREWTPAADAGASAMVRVAWLTRVRDWRENPGRWKSREYGPPPGQPGCKVAVDILREAGL